MFSCVNVGEYTLVEKKSRFIASSYLMESRDDAKRIQSELRAKNVGARHVCYAYIGAKSDEFGYDDDGEPSGTAGKPIYSALFSAGVRRSMIAVVRYFGGIKLGAGGLTRAYRAAASELISLAGISTAQRYVSYGVECDGETFKKITPLLRKNLCNLEQILYNDKVSFTAVAPETIDVISLVTPLGASAVELSAKYVTEKTEVNI